MKKTVKNLLFVLMIAIIGFVVRRHTHKQNTDVAPS